MSLTTELEQLVNEKSQLGRLLQSLEQEEKYLGTRFRVVEEKLAILALKERVRAKRASVEQLKSRISDLETRLKDPHTLNPQAAENVGTAQRKEPAEVIVKASPASNQPPEEDQPEKNKLIPSIIKKLK